MRCHLLPMSAFGKSLSNRFPMELSNGIGFYLWWIDVDVISGRIQSEISLEKLQRIFDVKSKTKRRQKFQMRWNPNKSTKLMIAPQHGATKSSPFFSNLNAFFLQHKESFFISKLLHVKLQSLIWICKVEWSFQQRSLNEKERENFSIKSQEKRSKMELCSIWGINCTSSALRTLLYARWIDENGSKWCDYEEMSKEAASMGNDDVDDRNFVNKLRNRWECKKNYAMRLISAIIKFHRNKPEIFLVFLSWINLFFPESHAEFYFFFNFFC